MPYFRTIIRGIERTVLKDGSIQELPVQQMGYTIQIPGHARSHTVEPGTGRRVFLPVNQNPNGALRAVFKEGVCYIPNPDTAKEEEFKALKLGNAKTAKKILDYLSDENNGLFGIDYEYDPNDRDDYWKNLGKLEEKPVIVKEYVSKEKAAKIRREVAAATRNKIAESDASAEAVGFAIGEGLQKADAKRKPGRPKGRPGVVHGAKSTRD